MPKSTVTEDPNAVVGCCCGPIGPVVVPMPISMCWYHFFPDFPPPLTSKMIWFDLNSILVISAGHARLHGHTVDVHFLLGVRLVQLSLRIHAHAPFPARQGNLGHPHFPQEAADDVNAGAAIHALFGKSRRE